MIKTLLRHLDQFRRDHRGAVLVEMTIITPLMLILSAGVFEFGNLIHDKLLMEAGLSDGARFAARCNGQLYTDYASAGFTAIDCTAAAKNIAVFGKPTVTGTDSARITGWQTSSVTVTSTSCYDAVQSGITKYRSTTAQVCTVHVSGTFPYAGIGMLSFIGIGPITLQSFHEERLIRF